MINDDNWGKRINKAYAFLSSVTKEAYKDIFLLSNQVLSKNPYTNNFLNGYFNLTEIRQPCFSLILIKLLRYYFFSFKDFICYLLEFIQYLFSSVHFKHLKDKKELILIDNFFLTDKIKEEDNYRELYFPGLVDVLKKKNKNYAYLPVFDGIKKYSALHNVFRILRRENIPLLSEYQLLSVGDLFNILFFVIRYPFKVIKLAKGIDNKAHEEKLLKSELIDTLSQVTFRSFSRFLQGKRIANLGYESIKVISWYENQVIDKNLYKGLRMDNAKVKIYGAQLFVIPRGMLNFIPDENETIFGIVPDKIMVNGPGYIPEKTSLNYAVGPSLRYSKILKITARKEDKVNILVSLPYLMDDAINILRVVNDAKNMPIPFLVKAHPSTGVDEIRHLLPSGAILTRGSNHELFKTTKILISSVSGTLVEAASLGIPSIVIKNPGKVDFNPLCDYGRGVIWDEASGSETLRQQIDKFEYELKNNLEQIENIANIYKREFFCDPDEHNISKSFDL